MAKDGTNRGGARVGAGAKKKPLADKISSGNPGGRKLTVMEFGGSEGNAGYVADLKGQAMPQPKDILSATQRDGTELRAKAVYEETWLWLDNISYAKSLCNQR